MTQQPYYPPQAPPPQPYQQPPAQYQPQFPQAPQQPYYAPQAPPQQYAGQPPYGAPEPPAPPLAQGNLGDYYSQPGGGSGPSIGWTDELQNQRPIGTTWFGVVARDVTDGDVEQQSDIKTRVPLFFRDGRPKFHLKVPLKDVALADPAGNFLPTPKLTEGEGTWFCKGQARDELVRAMAEAGASGAPQAGAVIRITLVQRRPNGGGMNPSNIVQITYSPASGGQASAATQPPAQQPVQQVEQLPPGQYAQPTGPIQGQPQQGQVPAQYAVPGQPIQALPPQVYAPGAQQIPPQPQVVPQAPMAPQGAVQPPADMTPEQQALYSRILSGQGQPAA